MRELPWTLGAAAMLALACGSPSAKEAECTDTAVAVADEGHHHVTEPTPVDYLHNPPASGNHWPCWAPWRVATTVLPKERFVHNLEHGGVVYLFQCVDSDSCPELKAPLVAMAAGAPDAPGGGHRIVVTARPDLPTKVAAVAWDFFLALDHVDTAALTCFAHFHEGHGLEDFADNPDTASCPQVY